jgi:HNH endonuclease
MIFEQWDIDLPKRLWPKIAMAGEHECWLWTASKLYPPAYPYGIFCTPDGRKQAHRVMFETYVGDIPSGMIVCHTCDNPSCVNPGHLFLGTNKDNSEDMVAKGRAAMQPNSPRWRETSKDIPIHRQQIRLTPEQEVQIMADDRPAEMLAKLYGVHRATINRARHRQGMPLKYRRQSKRKPVDGRIRLPS